MDGKAGAEDKTLGNKKHSRFNPPKKRVTVIDPIPQRAKQVKRKSTTEAASAVLPAPSHIPAPHKTNKPPQQRKPGRRKAQLHPITAPIGQESNPQVPPRATATTQMSERLEQQVLCGRLWHKQCQELNKDHPDQVPLSFSSEDQYISTFEPLLFEEARESVLSQWADRCDAAAGGTPVQVNSVEEEASGWLTLRLQGRDDSFLMHCHPNHILVLTTAKPPHRSQPIEWLQRMMGATKTNKRQRRRKGRHLDDPSRPHSASGSDDSQTPPQQSKAAKHNARSEAGAARLSGSPGNDGIGVLAVVVRQPLRNGPGDLVVQAFPLCNAHRHDQHSAPCAQVIGQLRRIGVWYAVSVGPLITQAREYNALIQVPNLSLKRYLLRPELLRELGARVMTQHNMTRMWPQEVSSPKFFDFLRSKYDHTQLQALEVACHFLGAAGHSSSEVLPFVLIQGPPGTGKTHTVKAILNVWHLVHYQRYYTDLMDRLMTSARARRGDHDLSEDSFLENILRSMCSRGAPSPNMLLRPRILVAAPSNAAVDELLHRIMEEGFADKSGGSYRPNVVRVGSADATMSERAREVWVDGFITRYLDMDVVTWQNSMASCDAELRQLRQRALMLQGRMSEGGQLSAGETDTIMRNLPPLHNELHRCQSEMDRLRTVQNIVFRRKGAYFREAREALEESFIREAEMVFTTLSSTGRRFFHKLQNEFASVLIDEAAQATELATLQALVFGCRHVVMVGDPQQLPATILSQRAKELQMERSLFERMQQAGCPATLLSVQYRMHPTIRQFPSEHFYHGQLVDAECITQAAPALFYEAPLLKPYVLFDVSHGQESRADTGSLRNQAEATLAAALFYALRTFLIEKAKEGIVEGCHVGVITPYRQQRDCIRQTFEHVMGDAAKEVMIETVDSFQGKQLDVVILSCVRASKVHKGVGFVNDVRRMNVAITRAKKALWILGDIKTLEHSQLWSDLIRDAQKRQVVIYKAVAAELFPDQPQFQPDNATPHPEEATQLPSSAVVPTSSAAAAHPHSVVPHDPPLPPPPPSSSSMHQLFHSAHPHQHAQHNAALPPHITLNSSQQSPGTTHGPHPLHVTTQLPDTQPNAISQLLPPPPRAPSPFVTQPQHYPVLHNTNQHQAMQPATQQLHAQGATLDVQQQNTSIEKAHPAIPQTLVPLSSPPHLTPHTYLPPHATAHSAAAVQIPHPQPATHLRPPPPPERQMQSQNAMMPYSGASRTLVSYNSLGEPVVQQQQEPLMLHPISSSNAPPSSHMDPFSGPAGVSSSHAHVADPRLRLPDPRRHPQAPASSSLPSAPLQRVNNATAGRHGEAEPASLHRMDLYNRR